MQGRRRNTSASTYDLPTMPAPTSDIALIFLCLFDGLRIPTIRRLSRKPQTVCFEPLNNFDPDLYSPTTTQMLLTRYEKQVHCPNVLIQIDPTLPNVKQSLRDIGRDARMTQRTIFHYFGQGSRHPDSSGKIYFFNTSRSQYQGIEVSSILDLFKYSLLLILDCNNAGVLYQHITDYLKHSPSKDIIAFFACQEGETLPSATNMPLDILSSSILDPLKSAIWFHGLNALNDNPIYLARDVIEESIEMDWNSEQNIDQATKEMKELLFAILNSIALSQFPENLYGQLYSYDESLKEIVNGFILATRILDYFNIHTVSHPKLPPTANAPQWCLWDIYLDGINSKSEGSKKTKKNLFRELKTTFSNFPSHSLVPIILFFLNRSSFQEEASLFVLEYMDYYGPDITPYSVNSIASSIWALKEPKEIHYIILAKLYLLGYNARLDLKRLFYANNPIIFKAAMLVIICSMEANPLVDKSKTLQLCANTASKCQPYAGILFALTAAEFSLLIPNPDKALRDFLPLLEDQREDVRVSAIMAISYTRQTEAILPIAKFVYDKSFIVAAEALLCLSMLIRSFSDNDIISEELKKVVHDAFYYAMTSTNEVMKQTLAKLTPFVEDFVKKCGLQLPIVTKQLTKMPSSRIPAILKKSILQKGFLDRYHSLFWENID